MVLEVICVLFFLLWQNLDLTKRKMIHEGPLVWKVNRDKSIGKSVVLSVLERMERIRKSTGGKQNHSQFSVSSAVPHYLNIYRRSACVFVKCKACNISFRNLAETCLTSVQFPSSYLLMDLSFKYLH